MRQDARSSTRRQVVAGAASMAMALVAGSAAMLPSTALAQGETWPNRPIRMIVPFPAGSFTDTIARVMSDGMAKALGQPVVVENKAGANGMIGVAEVARATPDGHTLVVTNSSSITINPQLYQKIPYKPTDLAPITPVVEAPFILVANPEWAQKNKIATVKDLLEYTRANPGKLSYGSAGPGNVAHLSFVMLGNRAGVKATHVPYKSASQAQMAVLSGDLQASFDTWSALPQIRAGKLKPLAISSNRRMSQLPDVPTIEQSGLPDFNVTFWIGMLAPAGTPAQVLQKLSAVARDVLDDPKARATLSAQGDIVVTDPAAFAKRINREVTAWGEVIQREGIKLD